MHSAPADMIAQLRKEILIRQGLKKTPGGMSMDMGLGSLNQAFPDGSFPLTAVHEFLFASQEDKTVTCGFIAGILASLMKRSGVVLWIGAAHTVYPPALAAFGILPEKIIFITLPREKDLLWVMEEALHCESLAAVVGEIHQLSFTASRRLQLAVEKSKVTGFLIRQTLNPGITACISRWKINTIASTLPNAMPGVGFPRWNVDLLKIRNGKPGTWQFEWRNNTFNEIPAHTTVEQVLHQKAV